MVTFFSQIEMTLPNEAADSSTDLLDAHAHIWSHIFSFIKSMSLKSAIQLGIPDAIHEHNKPMTLSQLADALHVTGAKSHGLYRVMRMLTHSKFFEKITTEGEEAYGLTGASRLLLRDAPLTMAPFALAMLDPILIDPLQHVSEFFRNEDPSPFSTKHGRDLWEYGGAEPTWNRMFNDAMASDARFVTSVLVRDCRQVFERLETLVDVGGGTGTAAKAIAGAFPGLRCTVLDLPHVVEGLEGAENFSYVGGDMFDFIPHADAVFLKSILHDWSDDKCIELLVKCREALENNDGAKVIIVDIVVNDEEEDDKATETQLFLDMMLMAAVNGEERTEEEWAKLFLAAGFTTYKIIPVLGLRSVIEVFP